LQTDLKDLSPRATWKIERRRPAKRPIAARRVYHRLLNLEQYPDTVSDALDFAETRLARAARNIHRAPEEIPFLDYSRHNLHKWFDERALLQARSYEAKPSGQVKTREEVIEEAVNLCPMILIDGAWIQRWAHAGLSDTPIGSLLYQILSDEIGNGNTKHNHPNIYRDLMSQMGVDIPDFRSEEFIKSTIFDDDAFEVPAFWLSISQFPRRFLPETLGLNLAMELSGVGGAYRTARDDLKRYDFDTQFVDLHNTIDNVSNGHSAMALSAVDMYMDDIFATHDATTASAYWRRIWVGFRALSTQKGRWIDTIKSPQYVYVLPLV
jgi:Iron-containing redox enzyme